MVTYKFIDNVFLVCGTVKHCIYNLNNYKLYHISNDLRVFIENIHNGINSLDLSGDDLHVIDYLLKIELITPSDRPSKLNDIKSLTKNIKIDFAWLEVTNTCNLKCSHCYNSSYYNKNNQNITVHNFKRAIDQLESAGIKKIQLIGGEPFCLGDDIIELMQYCLYKFDFIEIFSNLTSISDSILNFISKNNIKIATSIYSYDSKCHDTVTNINGSHAMTESNINKLLQHKIKYRVSSVKIRNIPIGTRHESCSYNITNIQDSVRISGRASKELIDIEYLRLNVICKDTFTKPLNINRIVQSVSGHNCFGSKIYIDKDLNVFPCVMERRMCHGNIQNNTIIECLNSDITLLNKSKINECSTCEFRFTCFDCRPNSFGLLIYDKPWYCLYKPIEGTWDNFENLLGKFFFNGDSDGLSN